MDFRNIRAESEAEVGDLAKLRQEVSATNALLAEYVAASKKSGNGNGGNGKVVLNESFVRIVGAVVVAAVVGAYGFLWSINAYLARLDERMVGVETDIKGLPPAYLIRDVTGNKADIEALEIRMRAVERGR